MADTTIDLQREITATGLLKSVASETQGAPNSIVAATASSGGTTGDYVPPTDPRLSDVRTPTAHKSSHATGGADALSPSDIGAATPSDIKDATLTVTQGGNTLGTFSANASADETIDIPLAPGGAATIHPYAAASGATIALSTATSVYRLAPTPDTSGGGAVVAIPALDAAGITASDAYYDFQLEVTVDDTATALSAPGDWRWDKDAGLPTSGFAGRTLIVDCRYDCRSGHVFAKSRFAEPFDEIVDYIVGDGECYVRLPIALTSGFTANLRIYVAGGNSSSTNMSGFFGHRAGGSSGCRLRQTAGNLIWGASYSGTSEATAAAAQNAWHDVALTWNSVAVDGGSAVTFSPREATASYSPIYISASGTGSSLISSNCRFGRIAMSSGTVSYDLIPVRVGEEGRFYDRVSKSLVATNGTGAFGYGSNT